VEHLNSIRLVGEHEYEVNQRKVKKHLVKIGAGVSNEQLRRWCITNGFQIKSNVIMVEINVCGALGTCSHGSGTDSRTLADYVYEIEFVDSNGKRQKISKKENPNLIKSAASALGLLGLVIFVTMELDEL
jgi:UDP-N-acetylenolpyruvoylglucosamine reductase